jgi:hypothetical protein
MLGGGKFLRGRLRREGFDFGCERRIIRAFYIHFNALGL